MFFRGSGVIMLQDLRQPKVQPVAPIETFPPSWLASWSGWLAGLAGWAGWLAGWLFHGLSVLLIVFDDLVS